MTTNNETKPHSRPTQAQVKLAIRTAKKLRKENPQISRLELAEQVGVSVNTLTKYLTHKAPLRKRAKGQATPAPLDDSDVFTRYLTAKQEFEAAKEALISHIQSEGL